MWAELVEESVAKKQRLKVYYFPDEVGQGEVIWETLPGKSVLRDKVMEDVPKKSDGWPKKLSAKENAAYLSSLNPEHRHCMVGLGGSQKGEVAWLTKRALETGNPGYEFDRVDVRQLIVEHGIKHLSKSILEKTGLTWSDVSLPLAQLEADVLEEAATAATKHKDNSKRGSWILEAAGIPQGDISAFASGAATLPLTFSEVESSLGGAL